MERDYPIAKITRASEPYHFERSRQHSNYPRPSQPNTSQPNQKYLAGWGMSTYDYWQSRFDDYLKRK